MKRLLLNLFPVTFIMIFIIGCTIKPNINKTFINSNIPENIKSDISDLDGKVIQAIISNSPETVSDIFSPKLMESGTEKLDSIFVPNAILAIVNISTIRDILTLQQYFSNLFI